MASSVELADAVADALGLSAQTVRHHLRNLGERKLVSYRGRGRHAADMTSLDAARLLIAAAGSQLVKDSVGTVERFGSLRRGSGRPMFPLYPSPNAQHPLDLPPPGEEPPPDDGNGEEKSAGTLESFLSVRIDRLRFGYPERRDRGTDPHWPRWSDRLGLAALELCGGMSPSDPRAFAVVRWWPPSGRVERAEFRASSSTATEHAVDVFWQYPDIPLLAVRYVSAHALDRIARAFGDRTKT